MAPCAHEDHREASNRCSDSSALSLDVPAESHLGDRWAAQFITSTTTCYHCSVVLQEVCWDMLLDENLCKLPYPSSVSLMMSQISMLRDQSSPRKDPSVALSGKQKPRQDKAKRGPGTLMGCSSAVTLDSTLTFNDMNQAAKSEPSSASH